MDRMECTTVASLQTTNLLSRRDGIRLAQGYEAVRHQNHLSLQSPSDFWQRHQHLVSKDDCIEFVGLKNVKPEHLESQA
jgi:hypothetical protein